MYRSFAIALLAFALADVLPQTSQVASAEVSRTGHCTSREIEPLLLRANPDERNLFYVKLLNPQISPSGPASRLSASDPALIWELHDMLADGSNLPLVKRQEIYARLFPGQDWRSGPKLYRLRHNQTGKWLVYKLSTGLQLSSEATPCDGWLLPSLFAFDPAEGTSRSYSDSGYPLKKVSLPSLCEGKLPPKICHLRFGGSANDPGGLGVWESNHSQETRSRLPLSAFNFELLYLDRNAIRFRAYQDAPPAGNSSSGGGANSGSEVSGAAQGANYVSGQGWVWSGLPSTDWNYLSRASIANLGSGIVLAPDCATDPWGNSGCHFVGTYSSPRARNIPYVQPLGRSNTPRLGSAFMFPAFEASTLFNNPVTQGPMTPSIWSIKISHARVQRLANSELDLSFAWTIDGFNQSRLLDARRVTGVEIPAYPYEGHGQFVLWMPVKASNSSQSPDLNAGALCSFGGVEAVKRRVRRYDGKMVDEPNGSYQIRVNTNRPLCDGGGSESVRTSEGTFRQSVINTGDFPSPIDAFVVQNGSILAWIRCPKPSGGAMQSCEWSYPSIYQRVDQEGQYMPYIYSAKTSSSSNWFTTYVRPAARRQWSLVSNGVYPSYTENKRNTQASTGNSPQLTISRQLRLQYARACVSLRGRVEEKPVGSSWPSKSADLLFLKDCLAGGGAGSYPSVLNLNLPDGSCPVGAILSRDLRVALALTISKHEGRPYPGNVNLCAPG